jgi:sugar phosphate isomerase/epimerase
VSVPVIFSTGSLWPFGLDRVFGWAVEAGYDGMEVMMDDRWDTHQAVYLNAAAEKHGIPILALHPPIKEGVWRLPPGETLIRAARLAQKISCPVVVAHPPPPGRPLQRWKAAVLSEARSQSKAAVAVENMPRNKRSFAVRRGSCYLPEHLMGVGDVTLDTSHVGASNIDLLETHARLRSQLRHIHLSDSDLKGGDQHRLPGKGKLPLGGFLGEIGRSDYAGAVSLELKPWPLGAPDPKVILERMKAALEFAREGLAGGWR